jgi:hypothetical protein
MRQILLAAFAAAAVLAGGAPLDPAAAMVPAYASPSGLAAANAGLVVRAVNVCGTNGCVRVQTQRIVKRHPPPLPPPHH